MVGGEEEVVVWWGVWEGARKAHEGRGRWRGREGGGERERERERGREREREDQQEQLCVDFTDRLFDYLNKVLVDRALIRPFKH